MNTLTKYEKAKLQLLALQERAYSRLGLDLEQAINHVRTKNEDFIGSIKNYHLFENKTLMRNSIDGGLSPYMKDELYESFVNNIRNIDYNRIGSDCSIYLPITRLENSANALFIQAIEPHIKKEFDELKIEYPENLIFSSLPSGDINGLFSPVEGTDFSLILFQENFCSFFVEAMWLFKVYSDRTESNDNRQQAVIDLSKSIISFVSDRSTYVRRNINYAKDNIESIDFFVNRMIPFLIFLVGHELGHKSLKHHLKINENKDIVSKWQYEFEADLFGFKLLANYFNKRNLVENQDVLPFFISSMYFHLLEFVYMAEELIENGESRTVKYPKSHPSPQFRKNTIESLIYSLDDKNRDRILSYNQVVNSEFDDLFEKMKPLFLDFSITNK